MASFNPGTKSTAICYKCKSWVSTTYKVRDVPLSDHPEVVVKDIVVGVCDICDSVVTTPPSATPKIRQAMIEAGLR